MVTAAATHTANILDVSLYIACGHTLCIHRYDFFFNISGQRCLVLLNQLRLKFTVSVSRHLDFCFTEACFKCLFGIPVTAVFALFVAIIVLGVTQFIIKLSVKTVFKHFSDHHFEYIFQVIKILHIKSFHDVT